MNNQFLQGALIIGATLTACIVAGVLLATIQGVTQ